MICGLMQILQTLQSAKDVLGAVFGRQIVPLLQHTTQSATDLIQLNGFTFEGELTPLMFTSVRWFSSSLTTSISSVILIADFLFCAILFSFQQPVKMTMPLEQLIVRIEEAVISTLQVQLQCGYEEMKGVESLQTNRMEEYMMHA